MSMWSLTYQQSVFKRYHSDKHFSVLLTRWRQKSTGIDMKQNYVIVTLCVSQSAGPLDDGIHFLMLSIFNFSLSWSRARYCNKLNSIEMRPNSDSQLMASTLTAIVWPRLTSLIIVIFTIKLGSHRANLSSRKMRPADWVVVPKCQPSSEDQAHQTDSTTTLQPHQNHATLHFEMYT